MICVHTHTHTQLVANYPVIYPAPVALTTQTKTIVFQVSPPLTAPVCLHREETLGRAIQAAPWLQHNTLVCVSSFGENYFKFYKSSYWHRCLEETEKTTR